MVKRFLKPVYQAFLIIAMAASIGFFFGLGLAHGIAKVGGLTTAITINVEG